MNLYKLLFLGLILISAVSCEDDVVEPELTASIDDFVGSWKATSFVFTNKSNAEEVVDLIALGGELRFTMLDNGGVRTWITIDTFSDEWDSQSELIDDNTIRMTPVEAIRGVKTYEFVLENEILELTDNNTSFDFTLENGTEVSATSVAIFARN